MREFKTIVALLNVVMAVGFFIAFCVMLWERNETHAWVCGIGLVLCLLNAIASGE